VSTPKLPPPEILDPFLRLVADLIVFNQQVADQIGLGMTDMQFLGHVQREGGTTPGRLSQMTGLSSGTVTGILDRLEKAGYVRRERDPDDRRRVLLHADVERLEREFGPLYAEQATHLADVVARFSASERKTIAAFLDALVSERR
jgi:DNA-binding MarR family transcriptional regulator